VSRIHDEVTIVRPVRAASEIVSVITKMRRESLMGPVDLDGPDVPAGE